MDARKGSFQKRIRARILLELDDGCAQKNGYFDEYARRTPGIMDGRNKSQMCALYILDARDPSNRM